MITSDKMTKWKKSSKSNDAIMSNFFLGIFASITFLQNLKNVVLNLKISLVGHARTKVRQGDEGWKYQKAQVELG